MQVRIYLVNSHSVMREMDITHRSNILGLYVAGNSGGIDIVDRKRAYNKFAMDGEIVLYHEYSHHYMLQYFPAAYPRATRNDICG